MNYRYALAICDVNDASTFAYGGSGFHYWIICKLFKGIKSHS